MKLRFYICWHLQHHCQLGDVCMALVTSLEYFSIMSLYHNHMMIVILQTKSKVMSYTNYFADSLTAEAERDSRIVAVHAAMAGGTGLTRFEKKFPERTFDVGIAEQHAVTFAAGLACEGLAPFCTIYSTFLQRGYDQVVHDVSLQKLPGRCHGTTRHIGIMQL